jgi:hypothetical protein
MNINKIWIVGFPKCGSTALRTYLQQKYAKTTESYVRSFPPISMYHPTWESRVLQECKKPNVLPVVITREPCARIWSSYWWSFRWRKHDITFEEFLKRDGEESAKKRPMSEHAEVDITSGLHDPIGCSDYQKYINKAKDCGVLVMRFEDMIKAPGFEHIGKTEDIEFEGNKLKYPPLDEDNKNLIKKAFDDRGASYVY